MEKITTLVLVVIVFLTSCMNDLLFTNPEDPTGNQAIQKYKPYNLTASSDQLEKIVLRWDKTEYASKYSIFRSQTETGVYKEIGETIASFYNDTNITSGIDYWYKVRTVLESKIITDFSDIVQGLSIRETGSLSPPSFLRASDGDSTTDIEISWDNVPTVDTYWVYRAKYDLLNEYQKIGETNTNNFHDLSSDFGTMFYYRVKSFITETAEISSNFSDSCAGWKALPNINIPIETTKGTLTEGVKLKWSEFKGANLYAIFRSDSEFGVYSSIDNVIADLEYTDITAIPGKKYWYKYKVATAMGTTGFSQSTMGYRKLSKPQNIIASHGANPTKITITWDDVLGATGYNIYRDIVSDFYPTNPINPILLTESEYIDIAPDGNIYYYKVKAISSLSDSQSVFSDAKDGIVSNSNVNIKVYNVDVLSSETELSNKQVIDLGNVDKGCTYFYNIQIKNTGTALLLSSQLPVIESTGACSLRYQPKALNLLQNETSYKITIQYTPMSIGVNAGAIEINTNSLMNNKFTLKFTGVATEFDPKAMAEVPGNIDKEYIEVVNRQVKLTTFWMGKYEVTYGLWKEVYDWAVSVDRGDNKYIFENTGGSGAYQYESIWHSEHYASMDNAIYQPVTYISFRDAIVWCNAYSEKLGYEPCYTIGVTVLRDSTNAYNCDYANLSITHDGYRLPTEAEWEYAARGGFDQVASDYSGSSNIDEVGWYKNNSYYYNNNIDDITNPNYAILKILRQTHDVGRLKPNKLGIYDLSGNVSEQCWDIYTFDVDDLTAVTDPTNSGKNTLNLDRVYRGGSYNYYKGYAQSNYPDRGLINSSNPGYGDDQVGFRVVRRPKVN